MQLPYLIMAIAGGALVLVQGWLASACERSALFYALWGARATNAFPEAQQ